MNAYELADQVEMWGEDLLSLNMKGGIPVIEGAKLIRQQADRIAELEKESKPVAWMSPDGKVSQTEGRLFYIPLYITPQTKPLSDEEIKELAIEHGFGYSVIGFARAIEERHGIK